jgi:ASC-1-like (ASCH) protein
MQVGDTIEFEKSGTTDKFNATISRILIYNTFESLINDFDIELLADKSMNKQELLTSLDDIYDSETQAAYHACAILLNKDSLSFY